MGDATLLVWERAGEERAARALPLGTRLDVGGPGADWVLDPGLTGYVVLQARLGGVAVEGVEGALLDGAPLLRGALLPPGTTLVLGAHRLHLRATGGAPLPQIPGYCVEGLLGQGGSGHVFRGARLTDGLPVALKVLAADADALTAARFRRELALVAGLALPGVARVHDLLQVRGRAVLVRELIEGPTLAERLLHGPLRREEALELGFAVAQALGGVHRAGIVHRDVKPENLVLAPRGPVLIDFDLATRAASQARASLTRLTQSGAGLGSLAYLPPEQLRQARDADARADVYGLGATLLHALTGRAPFAQVAPEDFLAALEQGPAALEPGAYPPGVSAVLARATAPDPAARFADGAALARALEATRGWTQTPAQWSWSPAEAPSGPPAAEVLDALRAHPGHLRVELGGLGDLDGREAAGLIEALRALSEVARPPVILVDAPQATAHVLYKVGLAPRFALDGVQSDQAYPG